MIYLQKQLLTMRDEEDVEKENVNNKYPLCVYLLCTMYCILYITKRFYVELLIQRNEARDVLYITNTFLSNVFSYCE